MLTIIATLLLAAPAPAAVRAADPAMAIKQGKLRCGMPDLAHKTCRTLASYTALPDGGFEVLVQGVPGNTGLTLSYRARGRVERGELCITITNDDITKASFTKAGIALVGAGLANERNAMRASLVYIIGHKICHRDGAPGPDGIAQSVASLDGEPYPELDKPIVWVDPGAGYVLGPLPADLA